MPAPSSRILPRAHLLATASLIALILLCIAWEFWLAPLRPGGSWLALKAVPLLAALPGVLRGRRYTFQWSALLILAYWVEGTVRLMSDAGLAVRLAAVELALAMVYFVAVVFFARLTRPT
jgi:uncharacterized membrane protein